MIVLITKPSGKGGVTHYCNAILPCFKDSLDYQLSPLEIGNSDNSSKWLHLIKDQLSVRRNLSNRRIDLMHVNPSMELKCLLREGMFIYWAKKKKIPVIVFFHGWDVPSEKLFTGWLKHFCKVSFLKADSFIVLASEFKKKLREWGVQVPIYLETTTVDDTLISDFAITKKIERLKNLKETKILFLARVEKNKGVFKTIKALKILLDRGKNVSLSIAGDGSAMREVKEYLSKIEYSRRKIKLLGFVKGEEKKSAYRSHDIYCFPTTYGEGMPTTVLEAMAFGMPVITRPVGGLKDFFENKKMGFITSKEDPEAIADIIEKMLDNKIQMIDMATYNHAYAKKHFLASAVAKRIEKIYKNIPRNESFDVSL